MIAQDKHGRNYTLCEAEHQSPEYKDRATQTLGQYLGTIYLCGRHYRVVGRWLRTQPRGAMPTRENILLAANGREPGAVPFGHNPGHD